MTPLPPFEQQALVTFRWKRETQGGLQAGSIVTMRDLSHPHVILERCHVGIPREAISRGPEFMVCITV